MAEDNCIFCKIIAGEIKTDFIHEDEKYIAFMDIEPVAKGHMLVIPKKHYQFFIDMPEDEYAEISRIVHKLANALKKATDTEYIHVGIEGVDVPHVHIHIIPRNKGDGLSSYKRTRYEDGEMKEFTQKIRSFL
ncbi:HIT domain-containing protein [Candidatus Woesearchaeota archaeon]|nr:HIT domain-containing protein [Candidatus Woesearchaeota archaeon]MBW3014212.1 HIT domain-containing protein [Candidatus Woesearchaeota archaeon]